MDQHVLKKPSKKWTESKLVIKFFTSSLLLRSSSVRKNFNTRLKSIRTLKSDAIFLLRTSPLRQLKTTSEISLLSSVRLNHLNYLVKLRTRALMHSFALKLQTPQVKPRVLPFNSVIASSTSTTTRWSNIVILPMKWTKTSQIGSATKQNILQLVKTSTAITNKSQVYSDFWCIPCRIRIRWIVLGPLHLKWGVSDLTVLVDKLNHKVVILINKIKVISKEITAKTTKGIIIHVNTATSTTIAADTTIIWDKKVKICLLLCKVVTPTWCLQQSCLCLCPHLWVCQCLKEDNLCLMLVKEFNLLLLLIQLPLSYIQRPFQSIMLLFQSTPAIRILSVVLFLNS